MDSNDDGYFHYNNNYAPIFFQPPDHQMEHFKDVMKGAIVNYLRSSCQDGLKHHNAILDCGLTAGEAAMIYFRDSKENKNNPTSASSLDHLLKDSIQTHLLINPDNFQEEFQRHLQISNVNEQNIEQKILKGLKAFLKDINQKPKGYTFILKIIVQDVREKKRIQAF